MYVYGGKHEAESLLEHSDPVKAMMRSTSATICRHVSAPIKSVNNTMLGAKTNQRGSSNNMNVYVQLDKPVDPINQSNRH